MYAPYLYTSKKSTGRPDQTDRGCFGGFIRVARALTEETDAWKASSEAAAIELRCPTTKASLWVTKEKSLEQRNEWKTTRLGESALRSLARARQITVEKLQTCGRSKTHYLNGSAVGKIGRSGERVWNISELDKFLPGFTEQQLKAEVDKLEMEAQQESWG